MLRASCLVAAAALVTADYSSFSPTISVYFQDTSCGSNSTVVAKTFSGTTALLGSCFVVDAPSGTYLKSAGCNFDNAVTGYTLYTGGSTASCSGGAPTSLDTLSPNLFDRCLPTGGVLNSGVVVQCLATPCCQTTGIMVSFAVILGLGAAGLCVYWAWTDKKAKASLKRDAEDFARSVAHEQAKVDKVEGFTFATGAQPTAGGTGYHAL